MFQPIQSPTFSLTNENSNSSFRNGSYGIASQIFQNIITFLTQPCEPKIRTIKTKDNQIFWEVYHPITKLKSRLDSEAEVCCWIDQYWHEVKTD